MKYKLRRLFQKAAPDVLDGVLQACPSMKEEEMPAENRTKKHSKFREFAATAAAVALLITMGSGLVWFVGNGGTLAGSQGGPTSGLSGTEAPWFGDLSDTWVTATGVPVDPDHTVGPPVGFEIGEMDAVNIVLHQAYPGSDDFTVDHFAGDWYVEMQERGYLVTLQYLGRTVEYLVSYEGQLMDRKVAVIDMMHITDARDAALKTAGVHVSQVSYLKIGLGAGEYYVEFQVEDKSYEVAVNTQDGTALVKNSGSGAAEDWSLENGDYLNWQAAVKMATKEFGSTPGQLSYLKVSASGSKDTPIYEVSVQFDAEPWVYYLQIDAATGEILLIDPNVGASSTPVTPDVPTGIMTPEQALTIAMEYVPEYVRIAYTAGVDGYKSHIEQLTQEGGWCYLTYIVSPDQTWTFLQDRHTGEILGSETDATGCEFKAWSQSGIFGTMEPEQLYVLREYDELTKLLDGDLPGMFHEDLFREHTVLAISLGKSLDSGDLFYVEELLHKADGNYVVTIDRSFGGGLIEQLNMMEYWTIFIVVNEKIPTNATVTYQLLVDTETYYQVDMDVVNTLYLLPADKVPQTWVTHLQWIRHGDRVFALIDQGSLVYYCAPETEDVDGDGIPELFLQDSKRIERCLRWDPAQGWFALAD